MTGFTLEFTFKDNSLIVIEGQSVRYWIGEGLPTFRGSLDEFAARYPEKIAELVKHKVLRKLAEST